MWIFLFQFIFAGIITLLFFKYRNDLNGWNKLEKKYLLSGHFNGSTTGFVAFDIHSLFGLRDKTGVVGVDDNFLYLALNLRFFYGFKPLAIPWQDIEKVNVFYQVNSTWPRIEILLRPPSNNFSMNLTDKGFEELRKFPKSLFDLDKFINTLERK